MSDDSTTRDGTLASPAVIARAQEQLFAAGKSGRQKYEELVVGRRGIGPLIKHELVVLAAQARSGALGLALRKILYPLLLGSCGRNVVFGQNVVLRHPHKIHIGGNVAIDDNCLLDAKGETNRGIRIGDGVFIGRNTILSCKNGDIELADGANVGFNCEIFSASRVTIGRMVLMAAYSYVIGGDHDFSDPVKAVLAQARVSAGVSNSRRRRGRQSCGDRRRRRRARTCPRRCDRRRHSGACGRIASRGSIWALTGCRIVAWVTGASSSRASPNGRPRRSSTTR